MNAAWVESGHLAFTQLAEPRLPAGWALVRVLSAGICGTDLALARGLYGFSGVPGHEFVGVVERGPVRWKGRRVVADINVACGRCRHCRTGLARHCPARRVIGMRGLNGAFADHLPVPVRNLVAVPGGLDDDGAVFAEPLAAALDAVGQVPDDEPVLVVGPGRLGQLLVRVLRARQRAVFCLGRSARSLAHLPHDVTATDSLPAAWHARFNTVVDCSGSPQGVRDALAAVRPRGTLVLKGTGAASPRVDLGRVVVDEIRLVGSRCGPMREALRWLRAGRIDPRDLITARHDLERIRRAFRDAGTPGQMKVLVRP